MSLERLKEIDLMSTGQDEGSDPANGGGIHSTRNLRLRKDGNWGVRADYTALGTQLAGTGGSESSHSKLFSYEGRLLALGGGNLEEDFGLLKEYVSTVEDFDWQQDVLGFVITSASRPASSMFGLERMLSVVSGVAIGSTSISGGDMELSGQLAAVTHRGPTGVSHTCHVFEQSGALLDSRIFTGSQGQAIAPADDGSFWFLHFSGVSVELAEYDPSSGEIGADSVVITGTGNITWMDVCRRIGGGAWVAVHRSSVPSTTITELDASGSVVQTITGPAVACDAVTVAESANRVHLAVVESSGSTVELSSYVQATGTQSPGSATTLFDGATTANQVGLATRAGQVCAYVDSGDGFASTPAIPATDPSVLGHCVDDQTHADEISKVNGPLNAIMMGKPATLASGIRFGASGTVRDVGLPVAYEEPIVSGVSTGYTAQFYLTDSKPNLAATVHRFIATPFDHSAQPAPKCVLNSDGYLWWVVPTLDTANRVSLVVFRAKTTVESSLIQAVEIGGMLYFTGGVVRCFDSVGIHDACFPERPLIKSLTAGTTGSLALGTYTVAVHWEVTNSLGLKMRSQVAEDQIELTGSDDLITALVHEPHYFLSDRLAARPDIKLFKNLLGRTELREHAIVPMVLSFPGDDLDTGQTFISSDDATGEIVYTQSGREALGTMLPIEAPLACRFIERFGDRLVTGGIADDPTLVQVSRTLIAGEVVNWSGDVAFFAKIPESVAGLAAQDEACFIFSRNKIWAVRGRGPNDAGEGEFDPPVEIPSSTGCKDARGIVRSPLGIMFVGDDDKIWLLPRGGSAPISMGDAVEDTLAAYTTVAGSALLRMEQLAVWAVTDGTNSRVVAFDLRSGVWSVDEFDGQVFSDFIAHNGRSAYIDGAGLESELVYLEDTDLVPATFIEHGLTTKDQFTAAKSGHGKLCKIIGTFRFKGACSVLLEVSYDGGQTWDELTASEGNDLPATTHLPGELIHRTWYPLRRKCERYRVRLTVSALGGVASEGLGILSLVAGIMPRRGGRRRKVA